MDGTYGGKEMAEGKARIQSKLTKPGRRLNSRLCQGPRHARIYNNLNFLFIECLWYGRHSARSDGSGGDKTDLGPPLIGRIRHHLERLLKNNK